MSDVYLPGLSLSSPAQSSIWGYEYCLPFTGNKTINVLYVALVNIPLSVPITGIQIFNSGAPSGNVKVSLYNLAGSSLLGSSGSVALSGSDSLQLIPFTIPWGSSPGSYYIGMIPDNSTTAFSLGNSMCSSGVISPGSFNIPATITPPAANARTGNMPIMTTY